VLKSFGVGGVARHGSQRALVEAENWNKLSTEIEYVFEAGDLRGVADKLGEMSRSLQVFRVRRQCLSLCWGVGLRSRAAGTLRFSLFGLAWQNLPQYEAHRDTLALLQNRFHAALSPQVMTALASYDSGRYRLSASHSGVGIHS